MKKINGPIWPRGHTWPSHSGSLVEHEALSLPSLVSATQTFTFQTNSRDFSGAFSSTFTPWNKTSDRMCGPCTLKPAELCVWNSPRRHHPPPPSLRSLLHRNSASPPVSRGRGGAGLRRGGGLRISRAFFTPLRSAPSNGAADRRRWCLHCGKYEIKRKEPDKLTAGTSG